MVVKNLGKSFRLTMVTETVCKNLMEDVRFSGCIHPLAARNRSHSCELLNSSSSLPDSLLPYVAYQILGQS